MEDSLPTKQFQKVVEDFICENCGTEVKGNGYTNHCPNCYWSKHVDDKSPGDRSSTCGGLMEPIGALQKGSEWVITHKCVECGKTMNQKVKEIPLNLFD